MGVNVLPPDVNHSAKTFTVAPTGFRISVRTISHFERDFCCTSLAKETVPEEWIEPLRNSMKILKNRDFKEEAEFLEFFAQTTESSSGKLNTLNSKVNIAIFDLKSPLF